MIDAAPGLGKTRLLEEAIEAAGGLQMQALTAAGRELERDFSFGLALQLFEGRLARAPEAARERLLSGAAGLARPLLEGARDFEDGAFDCLHGLYWLAANLADEQTLLLAIDDAQWSDRASLRFLLYLAQRVDRLPLALVVMVGRGDPPERDPLLDELAAHRSTTILRPRPLSPEAAAQLLRGSRFPDAEPGFAKACHEATGGNPFLLEGLALDLAVRGVPPEDENASAVLELVPGSISTSVLVRLRRLEAGALELARAVAVLGDGAELRHATALSGLGAAQAVRAADALMAAGVLEGGDPLRFVHPIVRAALDRERTDPECAEAHRRAAQLLLDEDAPADLVATQLLRARRDADPRAVEVLCEAARQAMAAGAPGGAVRLLRRALEEPPAAEQRAQVLLALGRAEATAGEAEAVERLTGAAGLMSDPAQRAAAALEAGRMLVTHGRWNDAARALERGLEQLDGAEGPLRERLESARATMNGMSFGATAAAGEVQLDDPALAETHAGRTRLAYAAAERAMRGEPVETVRELAELALANGALLDENTSDGLSYYLAVWALTLAEDIQTAELAVAAAIEDARSRGSVLGFATACHFRAMAVLRRGRVDDAAADAGNALAARRHGWGLSPAGATATAAECDIERGDLEAARSELDAHGRGTDPLDPGACQVVAARGRLSLVERRPAEALDDLLEAGRIQERLGWINPSVYPWRSLAAAAAMQIGDREQAQALVEEELALATSFGAPGAVGQALAGVASLAEGGRGRGGARGGGSRARGLADRAPASPRVRRAGRGAASRRQAPRRPRAAPAGARPRPPLRCQGAGGARARGAGGGGRAPTPPGHDRSRRLDSARASGRRTGRPGNVEPRDRRGAVRDAQDRRVAPQALIREGRRAVAPRAWRRHGGSEIRLIARQVGQPRAFLVQVSANVAGEPPRRSTR